MRNISFILIALFIFSCGDGNNKVYNQVYLKLDNMQFLYFYNQAERHLCINDDISICQQKYPLTNGSGDGKCSYSYKTDRIECEGVLSYSYQYVGNEKLIINTGIGDYTHIVSVIYNNNERIFYANTFVSADDSYLISSSQHIGLCDITLIDELFRFFIKSFGAIGIKFDYNSLTLNPDICRLAQLINCIGPNFASAKLTEGKEKEKIINMSLQCFSSIYSFDEAKVNNFGFPE